MLRLACAVLALAAADTGRAVPVAPAVAPASTEAAAGDAAAASVLRLRPARAPSAPAASWAGDGRPAPADTLPRRPVVVDYSEGYATRLKIHRIASYATIPLFAAEYASGSQLISHGRDAPGWARSLHPPTAAGVATLFAVNTVTGGWNMWEARKDPEERTRRTVHGLLMLAADAGFAITGALASDADESQSRRNLHRDVAIGSMAVSLVSYAIMLPPFRRSK